MLCCSVESDLCFALSAPRTSMTHVPRPRVQGLRPRAEPLRPRAQARGTAPRLRRRLGATARRRAAPPPSVASVTPCASTEECERSLRLCRCAPPPRRAGTVRASLRPLSARRSRSATPRSASLLATSRTAAHVLHPRPLTPHRHACQDSLRPRLNLLSGLKEAAL